MRFDSTFGQMEYFSYLLIGKSFGNLDKNLVLSFANAKMFYLLFVDLMDGSVRFCSRSFVDVNSNDEKKDCNY